MIDWKELIKYRHKRPEYYLINETSNNSQKTNVFLYPENNENDFKLSENPINIILNNEYRDPILNFEKRLKPDFSFSSFFSLKLNG